jgi:hypothetical protein
LHQNQGAAAALAQKAATVIATQFPILRQGRIVQTTAAGRHRALTFAQSEKAIDLLEEQKDLFLAAVRDGVAKGAAAQGAKFKWLDERHPLIHSLSPARRSQTLGAIFDFAELAFEIDGAVSIFRACVTVCVKGGEADAQLPYSKFWTRYLLVSHPKSSNGLAENVPPKDLVAYEARCSALTAAAIEAMAPLYVKIISDLIGQAVEIDFKNNGELSVLALDTKDGDFPTTFASLQAGNSLGKALQNKHSTARKLVELAAPALAGKAYQASNAARLDELFPQEDYQLVAYQSTDSDRGLFLVKIDDNRARFVGLTRAPEIVQTDGEDPARQAHAASSSVVSGGLVTQYGMQF